MAVLERSTIAVYIARAWCICFIWSCIVIYIYSHFILFGLQNIAANKITGARSRISETSCFLFFFLFFFLRRTLLSRLRLPMHLAAAAGSG